MNVAFKEDDPAANKEADRSPLFKGSRNCLTGRVLE